MAVSAGKDKWVGLIDDQKFFEKNTKLNRPMSPFFSVYRWPVCAFARFFIDARSHRVVCSVRS